MKSWLKRLAVLAIALGLVGLLAPTASANPGHYPGYKSYPAYNARTWAGPTVPYLGGYVPQGLAHWSAQDDMIVSYYDDNDGLDRSLLAVVDRLSGKVKKHVYVLSGHVGGMAVSGKYLWVADTVGSSSLVRRYSLAALKATKNGGYLGFQDVFRTKASSYLTIAGGDVWVGRFTTEFGKGSTMYRYNITKKGALSKNPIATIATPGRVQGAAFSGNYVFFSQSYGRTNTSRITVKNRKTGKSVYLKAPTQSEDITIADGWLYILYESGASFYRNGEDGKGKSKNPITQLHYASVSGLKGLL
jgi:hypothetical protein